MPPPDAPVDALVLTANVVPATLTLDDDGEAFNLRLEVRDGSGALVSFSGDMWTSSEPAIAAVMSGRVISGATGTTTVTATVLGLTATATVHVRSQPNPACTPLIPPAQPPSIGAPGTWLSVPIDTHYDPPAQGADRFGEWVAPLDLDADGDVDLLTDHMSITTATSMVFHDVRAYRNNGSAVFTDATSALLSPGETFGFVGPSDPELVDIDRDGRLDLLVGDNGYDPGGHNGVNCGNANVCTGARDHLLIGTPNGPRDLGPTAFTGPVGFTTNNGAADVDCDGDLDVLQARWPNGSAPDRSHLLMNDGAQHFTAHDSKIAFPPGVTTLRLCDLDRDGDPDVFVSASDPGRGRIYVNNGFGSFRLRPLSAVPEAPPGDAHTQYIHARCADIDLDGYPDLILPLDTHLDPDSSIRVLHNNHNLTFTDVTANTLPNVLPPNRSVSDFFVADFNRDGWPDLFVVEQTNAVAQVFWNRGGTFQAAPRWPSWPDPLWTLGAGGLYAVGDFDGDQRPDIFVDRGPYESGMVLAR